MKNSCFLFMTILTLLHLLESTKYKRYNSFDPHNFRDYIKKQPPNIGGWFHLIKEPYLTFTTFLETVFPFADMILI